MASPRHVVGLPNGAAERRGSIHAYMQNELNTPHVALCRIVNDGINSPLFKEGLGCLLTRGNRLHTSKMYCDLAGQLDNQNVYTETAAYLEFDGFCIGFLEESGQMDRQERRDVPAVKQTDVPQVNRFLEHHRRRNHLACYEVPRCPHILPLINCRDGEWRACNGFFVR